MLNVLSHKENYSDAIHISEVDIWTQGTNLFDIRTFAIPLLTYILLKIHIKWVPHKILDKEDVHRLSYINIYIIVE